MPRKNSSLLLAAALGLCFMLSGCYGHYGYHGYGHRYYDDYYRPGADTARRRNSYDFQYREHHRVTPPKRVKEGYPGYRQPRREKISPAPRPGAPSKPGFKAGGPAGRPNEKRRPSAIDREAIQSGPQKQPQLNNSSRPRETQIRRQAAPANKRIERSRPRQRP